MDDWLRAEREMQARRQSSATGSDKK